MKVLCIYAGEKHPWRTGDVVSLRVQTAKGKAVIDALGLGLAVAVYSGKLPTWKNGKGEECAGHGEWEEITTADIEAIAKGDKSIDPVQRKVAAIESPERKARWALPVSAELPIAERLP